MITAPESASPKIFDINVGQSHGESNLKLRITLMAKAIKNIFIYMCIKHNLDEKAYELDERILLDLCERYFRDVVRLHHFHKMERIDRHKIAGYVTYWICRLRPIRVINKDEYNDNENTALQINELFAAIVAFGRIKHYFNSESIPAKTTLNQKFKETFLYDLRYRLTTGDNLSLVYYLIEINTLSVNK